MFKYNLGDVSTMQNDVVRFNQRNNVFDLFLGNFLQLTRKSSLRGATFFVGICHRQSRSVSEEEKDNKQCNHCREWQGSV